MTSTIRRPSRRSSSHSWPQKWDHLKLPTTEAQARALVADCPKRLQIMEARVAEIRKRRGLRAAKSWARAMRSSASARIAAVSHANTKRGLKWNALAICRAAFALSLTRRSKEPVFVDLVENSDGTFRAVYAFGPREYARQWLALQSVKSLTPIAGQMFQHAGGVPAAAKWLEAEVTATSVITTTDIPDAFWVLCRKHLEADGLLPRPVMKSVLYDTMSVGKRRSGKPLMGGTIKSPIQMVAYYGSWTSSERGIPAGSATASLLAEYRIWSMLSAALQSISGVKFGVYLDNIILLTSSIAKARAAMKALRGFMLNELGPDVANEVWARKRTNKAAGGFYYLKDAYEYRDGKLRRSMAEDAHLAYGAKLAERVRVEQLDTDGVRRSIASWARQRGYDQHVSQYAAELLVEFKAVPDST